MASENASDCVSANSELSVEETQNLNKSPQRESSLASSGYGTEAPGNFNPQTTELESQSSVESGEISEDQLPQESTDKEITASLNNTETVATDIVDCVSIEEPSQVDEFDSKDVLVNSSIGAKVVHENVEASSGNSTKQRLLDLENEVQRLRIKNEQLIAQQGEGNLSDCADITIHFKDRSFYDLHQEKLTSLFKTFINYYVVADDSKLQITVTKDYQSNSDKWIVVEDNDMEVSNKKRKKKIKENDGKKKPRKEVEEPEELEFILDTTPSLNSNSNCKYESKFNVTTESNEENKQTNGQKVGFNNCFNCGEDHNMRDCPKPKNMTKINAARQKFKREQQPKNVRYHLENDAYGHLKPGKISNALREALHVNNNELPEYIYRMRNLGYPPGWIKEISQGDSDLMVFDSDGKFERKKKQVEELNENLIIEYPGFNVPAGRYTRDDHKYYSCPSFSRRQSKNIMLEEINKKNKAAADNLDTCDMDLDTSFDDEQERVIRSISPTLLALESEKKKILDQLSVDNAVPDIDNSQILMDDCYKTLDQVGEIDSEIDISNTNSIKGSSFGTPIIESSSPYSALPNSENFAKDVSQVVVFQNLPESTGKFDQLTGILSKVRKTMQDLYKKST